MRNPQKTMPRAILGALAIVTTIYVLVAVSALGTQPWQEFGDAEQGEAGLAKILQDVVGASWPGTILSAGAVISIFSVTLVTMYGQTRILFAIGRDGLLPRAFARVNPRTHTPVNNTVIVAIVVGLLAAFIPLDYLWDLVSIGTLIAFIVVSVGVVILRRTRPDLPRGFKVPGYPVTPVLAVLACLYILSGLHWYTYAWFLLWLSVVLAFYFLWGRKHSAAATRRSRRDLARRRGRCDDDRRRRQPVRRPRTARSTSASRSPARCPRRRGAFVLVVATVIPPGWTVPSMARVDGEMQEWIEARADEAEAAALEFLAGRADELTVEFVRLTDRSTPRALAALAEQRDATALVLGSSPRRTRGPRRRRLDRRLPAALLARSRWPSPRARTGARRAPPTSPRTG